VEYFQKAIEINERHGYYHTVSISKLNLGGTYIEMRDYKKAEKIYFGRSWGCKKGW
jgi:tetratricopeptide (TPR) repeat protein